MANRTCPDCHEIIKAKAVVCKHCGRGFSAAEMDAARRDARFPLYLVAVVIGVLALSSLFQRETQAPTAAERTASAREPCRRAGGSVRNASVTVSRSVDLRASPSTSSERLVNERATEITGETHYQAVDNTTRLIETCRAGEWSQVQMVEPAWLAGRKGWIPAAELRSIEADTSGERQYVEADFYWDSETRRYRHQLTAAINRIVRENQRCVTIDPGTLSRSRNRGNSSNPVFFITCNSGSDVFNVWFRLDGSQLSDMSSQR